MGGQDSADNNLQAFNMTTGGLADWGGADFNGDVNAIAVAPLDGTV